MCVGAGAFLCLTGCLAPTLASTYHCRAVPSSRSQMTIKKGLQALPTDSWVRSISQVILSKGEVTQEIQRGKYLEKKLGAPARTHFCFKAGTLLFKDSKLKFPFHKW